MDPCERYYNCSMKLGETSMFLETIYADDYISIDVHDYFDSNHANDDLYFKVYNGPTVAKSTECCRIKIFKAKYKYTDDNLLKEFVLSDAHKKHLIFVLMSDYKGPNKDFVGTNWEYILYLYRWAGVCNPKMRNLLKKAKHKMPDYRKL